MYKNWIKTLTDLWSRMSEPSGSSPEMSTRDWADLPTWHPDCETCGC